MTDHDRDPSDEWDDEIDLDDPDFPDLSGVPETGIVGLGPADDEDFRSGFVTLYGRPNTGKSTLLNKILHSKVSITSDKAQTTRHQIRGVLNHDDAQIVFVDTPGVGKPRSALGRRLNATATEAKSGVDLVCFVFDARAGFGRGDAFLVENLDPAKTVIVANKIDNLGAAKIGRQLAAVAYLDASAYFPVSAQTGEGIDRLVAHLSSRMPRGPHWYPPGQITDQNPTHWVAELVREQLLRATRDEVPHSVATRIAEWEPPYVRVEILVERESQKAIVIGKGGDMLKEVGERARRRLPANTYLELFVTVDRNWHHSPERIEELGY